MGTMTSIPAFWASFARTTPWFSSFVVSLKTLSPSMARAGAVEQHDTSIMSLESEYDLMFLMLELVSGPIIMSTPRALRAVSLSRATTGLVAESSPIKLMRHGSSASSRYLLKSSTPSFAASMFSVPWLASSPVRGSMYPMSTIPDSPDASSIIVSVVSSVIISVIASIIAMGLKSAIS